MKDAHKREVAGSWCKLRNVRQAVCYICYGGAQFYFLFLLPKQHAPCEMDAAVDHVPMRQDFYFCLFLIWFSRPAAAVRELCGWQGSQPPVPLLYLSLMF